MSIARKELKQAVWADGRARAMIESVIDSASASVPTI